MAAWIQRHRWVVYAAVIVAAFVGVAAARHIGPFGGPAGSASTSSGLPPISTTVSSVPSSPSTPTTVELVQRRYNPGDCVTWNRADAGAEISTSVVPCSRPHLVEIVSKATIPSSISGFPSAAGWLDLATILCAKPIRSYLGYPLDPAGRFVVSSLNPTQDGWGQGDRTFFCGIGLGNTGDAPSTLFTGRVRGQGQEHLDPIGTCLSFSGAASTNPVPCTQPHFLEVDGNASLASLPQFPQGSTTLADAVQSQCAAMAEHYAGGPLPAGVMWNYLFLARSSWDAGDRLVQCTIGTVNNTFAPTASTGSLKG